MGKKMDKADVIYGENHNQPLKGWNKWSEVEALIRDKVGPNAKVDWLTAKSLIKQAQADKGMNDAYIKIGLVGNDLVLRAKAKKFLGDRELDAVLVKGYKSLAAQYKDSPEKIEDKGRELIVEELRSAKKRDIVWSALNSLGASKSEVQSLDSSDAAMALFKRLKIDQQIAAHLNSQRLLLTDRGYALMDIPSLQDRKQLYLKLAACGAKPTDLANLHSPDAMRKLCKNIGLPNNVTDWLVNQTWALSDRGMVLAELEKIPAPKQIPGLLKKAGMKPAQLKSLYGEGRSIEAVAEDLVGFGVRKPVAEKLAEVIIDSAPDTTDQKLIEKLPTIKDAALIGKVLDQVGMKAWRMQVSDGGGVDLDAAAKELADALGISDKEADRITNMLAP